MNATLWKVAIITLSVLGFSAGKVWYEKNSRDTASKNQDLAFHAAAAEINRTSPKMVDEVTRLDSAVYAYGKMTTFYTLPKLQRSEVNKQEFLRAGRSAAVAQLCTGKTSLAALRKGLTYGFVYRDSTGSTISEFQVNQTDCR